MKLIAQVAGFALVVAVLTVGAVAGGDVTYAAVMGALFGGCVTLAALIVREERRARR